MKERKLLEKIKNLEERQFWGKEKFMYSVKFKRNLSITYGRRCHFCNKRMGLFIKYVKLEPTYSLLYTSHLECFVRYMLENANIASREGLFPFQRWGETKEW